MPLARKQLQPLQQRKTYVNADGSGRLLRLGRLRRWEWWGGGWGYKMQGWFLAPGATGLLLGREDDSRDATPS